MARKKKIDNAVLKRLRRQEQKDKTESINIRKFVLIVCEGTKTEPNYFEALRRRLPKNVLETVVVDIIGTGANTLSVVERTEDEVEKAKKVRNKKFDSVWVVIDKDGFPPQNFNNSIFRCEGLGYNCAWSNEAFELWYVLHFQYRNTGMSREAYSKVIEDEINSKIKSSDSPSIGTFKYKKNDSNMFDFLEEFGDVEFAKANAKKLVDNFKDMKYSTHNPCTKVYELVEYLESLRKTSEEN